MFTETQQNQGICQILAQSPFMGAAEDAAVSALDFLVSLSVLIGETSRM
jgi:hypothetical protein